MPSSGRPPRAAPRREHALLDAQQALREGHPELARAAVQPLLDAAAADPQALLTMAKVELAGARLQRAERLAQQALGAGASALEGQVIIALCAEAGGNAEVALDSFAALARSHPHSALVHFQLGRLRAALGRSTAAVAPLRLALEHCERGDQRYQIATLLGTVLAGLCRYPSALAMLRQAVELAPRRLPAYLALAEAFERADDRIAATAVLAEAERRTGGGPQLWRRQAELLAARGALDEARRRAGWWCEASASDSDAWLLAARLASRAGDQAAAEHAAERAHALDPDASEPHHLLGTVHDTAARPAQAEHHYREALRLRPDAWQPANDLALLLLAAGGADRVAEAVGLLDEAIELSGGRRYQPALNLAIATARLGDRERCAKLCEQLARRPLPAAARERLAALREQMGGAD